MIYFDVYDFEKFIMHVNTHDDYKMLPISISLNELGFKSVKFDEHHEPDNWYMSDSDYTLFLLRWA